MGVGAQEDEEETAVAAEGGSGEEREQVAEEGGREEGQAAEDVGDEGREAKAAPVVSCSICLDTVVPDGEERSTARLKCGHEFHLDCIGSAFNAKGIMQCPNCRKIEMGNWIYANGSRSSQAQDANNDEWGHHDEGEVARSDMATFVPLRIQWCPIGRLPALLEELDNAPPTTFNDFMGPNFNPEQVPVSLPATAHPGPYLAYFQPVPVQPPASVSSLVAERTMDGAAYHDHWNPMAGPSDGRPVQTVQPIDFHHTPWAHMPHSYSQSNHNNGVAEQPVLPAGVMRVAGVDSDSQQRGSLPSFYGNGSGAPRIPSVPPMAPQFIRAHGNINDQLQQSSSLFAGSQRSGGMHPLGIGGSAVAPPENTFCLFPPASSGPSTMEPEDIRGSQYYAWERDRLAPYPLVPVNNEGTWWSSSQQQQPHGTPEPASASRRLPGQWIGGAARSPPQENRLPDDSPFRPLHIPRM